MCKVALHVENERVKFIKNYHEIKYSLKYTKQVIFNLPVHANNYSIENKLTDIALNASKYITTNRLDASFVEIDFFLKTGNSERISVVDIQGDQNHLTKLLAHLCESNTRLQIVVWKKNSKVKEVVSIDQCKLTYISIPKCGSSSTRNYLRTAFEPMYNEKVGEHRIQTAESLLFHADITSSNFQGHRFFSVVRNPYTRIASLYNSRVKKGRYISPALINNYGDDTFATFIRFIS